MNDILQMLGLADTVKAIFPPFPLPGFVPNFTGYDLDQQNIDWNEVYNVTAPNNEAIYVRTVLHIYINRLSC